MAKEIIRPCAACKNLGRGCNSSCDLAPYFPPDNPQLASITLGRETQAVVLPSSGFNSFENGSTRTTTGGSGSGDGSLAGFQMGADVPVRDSDAPVDDTPFVLPSSRIDTFENGSTETGNQVQWRGEPQLIRLSRRRRLQ